jgi:hypothetical protein
MKMNDLVTFTNDKSRYAKWFFGQLAIAESVTQSIKTGDWHCRVRWLQPVKYFDRYATVSDFNTKNFEVHK